jgi:hypothetical protein
VMDFYSASDVVFIPFGERIPNERLADRLEARILRTFCDNNSMRLLISVLACAVPLVAAGPHPHPRLEVTADLLKQVRSLRQAGNSIWTDFERNLKERTRESGSPLPSLFYDLVTGERTAPAA